MLGVVQSGGITNILPPVTKVRIKSRRFLLQSTVALTVEETLCTVVSTVQYGEEATPS